jgi:hypothetical protein
MTDFSSLKSVPFLKTVNNGPGDFAIDGISEPRGLAIHLHERTSWVLLKFWAVYSSTCSGKEPLDSHNFSSSRMFVCHGSRAIPRVCSINSFHSSRRAMNIHEGDSVTEMAVMSVIRRDRDTAILSEFSISIWNESIIWSAAITFIQPGEGSWANKLSQRSRIWILDGSQQRLSLGGSLKVILISQPSENMPS